MPAVHFCWQLIAGCDPAVLKSPGFALQERAWFVRGALAEPPCSRGWTKCQGLRSAGQWVKTGWLDLLLSPAFCWTPPMDSSIWGRDVSCVKCTFGSVQNFLNYSSVSLASFQRLRPCSGPKAGSSQVRYYYCLEGSCDHLVLFCFCTSVKPWKSWYFM